MLQVGEQVDTFFERIIKHIGRGKMGQLLDRVHKVKSVYVVQGRKLNVYRETKSEDVKLHANIKSVSLINWATYPDNSCKQCLGRNQEVCAVLW